MGENAKKMKEDNHQRYTYMVSAIDTSYENKLRGEKGVNKVS